MGLSDGFVGLPMRLAAVGALVNLRILRENILRGDKVTFLSYSLHLNLLLLCPLRNVLSLVPIMALQIC